MIIGTFLVVGFPVVFAYPQDWSDDTRPKFISGAQVELNSRASSDLQMDNFDLSADVIASESDPTDCSHASSDLDDTQDLNILRRGSSICPVMTTTQKPPPALKKVLNYLTGNQRSTGAQSSAKETATSQDCTNHGSRQQLYTCSGPEIQGKNPLQYVLNCVSCKFPSSSQTDHLPISQWSNLK